MPSLPNPRQLALPALAASAEASRPKFAAFEPLPFMQQRAELERVPHALDYLKTIQAALCRGLKIPAQFHDHALKGRAAALRSVIVGELEESDVAFILLYRKRGAVIDFLYVDQHDDAYETLRRLHDP